MASSASKLDSVYRSLLLTRFFTKGWGKPEHLKRIFELRRNLADRSVAYTYVDRDHPVTITRDDLKTDHRILEGHFITPFVHYLPQLLPPESERAHFQVILPIYQNPKSRPVCIQYAGTGDHYYWRRRRLMALPLLRERGVASVLLENPFYGLRKPKNQLRSSLQQVSDLFVMGACLILESLVIFHWCERQGLGPLVAHGISMGGHMASLGATVWPKPIGLVPCLSWTSASLTFTKGVMTGSIPWDILEKQYSSLNAYKDEVIHMIESEENAFRAGVEFAQQLDKTALEDEKKFNNGNDLASKDLQKSLRKANEDHHEQHQLRRVEAEADGKQYSSYTSILEALHLPFLSSLSTSLSLDNKMMLPKIIRNDLKDRKKDSLHRETVHFMRGIMDECTHLNNFDTPVDPSLVYIVVAENDAYQPREGVANLIDIWPGANLRFIKGNGHVSSYLFKQDVFRQAIYDAIDAMEAKY